MSLVQVERFGDVITKTYVDEGKLTIYREQDVEPILARNAARAEEWNSDLRRKRNMYYAGSIPVVVIEEYLKVTGIKYDEFIRNPEHVKRMLNDPALRGFRVWKGRV